MFLVRRAAFLQEVIQVSELFPFYDSLIFNLPLAVLVCISLVKEKGLRWERETSHW